MSLFDSGSACWTTSLSLPAEDATLQMLEANGLLDESICLSVGLSHRLVRGRSDLNPCATYLRHPTAFWCHYPPRVRPDLEYFDRLTLLVEDDRCGPCTIAARDEQVSDIGQPHARS